MALNQLSGVNGMSGYSSIVFQEAGSSTMSPNMSVVVIGVIQLIGTCTVTCVLVDRLGRKVIQNVVSDHYQY